MKRITSYDLTFAIPHNPDADDAYVEQLLDDEQAREKERQERLIQEEEARKLRALARKRSALVKIVALIIVCIDLLRRLTEDLPPNPLIGPLRILAGWGIRLAKVANFAVAEPVHETYDSYFVDWPPEMSDFANRVKRSAEKMAAAVEALIEDLPEELLRNGGIPSIKSSPEPRREPSEPQSKEHTFTVTTRNQIQQALKDLRKELQKALNTKELPDCMPEEGSRLGDYEVLRSFEQEWRKNTPDCGDLQVYLADTFSRMGSLLIHCRPLLTPDQNKKLCGRLITIRKEIPVPLAKDAMVVWIANDEMEE